MTGVMEHLFERRCQSAKEVCLRSATVYSRGIPGQRHLNAGTGDGQIPVSRIQKRDSPKE